MPTSFFNFGFLFFTLFLRIHEFFGFETAAEHCGICWHMCKAQAPPDRWYFDYIAGASSVITACITGDRIKVKPQYLNSD